MMQEPMSYSGPDKVMVGNGKTLPISHVGHNTLPTPHYSLQLKNILHTPYLSTNHLSVSKLCSKNNAYVEFHPHSYFVKDQVTNQVLLQGNLEHGLYRVPFNPRSHVHTTLPQVCFLNQADSNLWHSRLGHPSSPVVSRVLSLCKGPGAKSSTLDFCSSCQMDKSHKLPFVLSQSKSMKPLDLIHSDLWGPSPVQSVTSVKYFLSFIDDYSRFSWLYFLKTKDEVFSMFLKFKLMVKNLFESKIKEFHFD